MANWDMAKTRRRLEIAIAELGRAYPEKLAADDAFTAMTEALRDDKSSAPVAATKKTAIATAPMQQDGAPEGRIGDDVAEPSITSPASSPLAGDVATASYANSDQSSKDVEASLC